MHIILLQSQLQLSFAAFEVAIFKLYSFILYLILSLIAFDFKVLIDFWAK